MNGQATTDLKSREKTQNCGCNNKDNTERNVL